MFLLAGRIQPIMEERKGYSHFFLGFMIRRVKVEITAVSRNKGKRGYWISDTFCRVRSSIGTLSERNKGIDASSY